MLSKRDVPSSLFDNAPNLVVVGCIIQKTIYTYVVYFLYRPVHLGAERTFVQSDATNCASRHRTVQRTHSSNPPSPPTILYVLLAHISAYIIGKIKPSFKKKIQRRNKISPVWFFPCWLITMKNIRFCDVYRKFVYVNRRQHIQNFIMWVQCNVVWSPNNLLSFRAVGANFVYQEDFPKQGRWKL